MSSQLEEVAKTVKRVTLEAEALYKKHFEDCTMDFYAFIPNYQMWFSEAVKLIEVLLPERLEEFRQYYSNSKRKEIDYLTYTVQDYLLNLVIRSRGEPTFNTKNSAAAKFIQQIYILQSISRRQTSIVANLRSVVQADLFDTEVDAARELYKNGHLRAAGIVSGVVLERHLSTVCKNHNVQSQKKSPGISDFNDLLKGKDILDVPNWRFIQRLADIRNLCAHPKDREPTADEVLDLINGTEKIIKSIF